MSNKIKGKQISNDITQKNLSLALPSSADTSSASTVGYVNTKISETSGVIGLPEFGTGYTNGLFTDFNTGTTTGVPIDRFNQVLLALSPSPAPNLSDCSAIKSLDSVSAYLSFDASNPIPSYTSTPQNINTNFAASGKRIGVSRNNGSDISGTLNFQTLQDGINYGATSFGNADKGNLLLYINGVLKSTMDLTNLNAQNNTIGNTVSGFIIKTAENAKFPMGGELSLFKHRSGSTYLVKSSDLILGYNYIEIKHDYLSTSIQYVEVVVDADTTATVYSNATFDGLAMAGIPKFISGIEYYSQGFAYYNVTISNAYRNTYIKTNGLVYGGSNVASVSDNIPDMINYTDDIIINNKVRNINVPYLTGSITSNVQVLRSLPTKSSPISSTLTISGICMNNQVDNSTLLIEYFKAETYRLSSDSNYDNISDISTYGWFSNRSIQNTGVAGYNDALQVLNDTLDYPNINFSTFGSLVSNLNYGDPATNYSTCTGNRSFYRFFYAANASGLFTINVAGVSTTFVNVGTFLNSNNANLEIKLPTQTAWMDCSKEFITNQWTDGSGCKNQGITPLSLGNNCALSIGTKSTGNSGGYIVIRFTVSQNWAGTLNQITFAYS